MNEIAIPALVLGAVGTGGALLMSVIFCLLFCLFWWKTQKEIRLLKFQVEKGTAGTSVDPNMLPLTVVESGQSTLPHSSIPVAITSSGKPSIQGGSRGYSSVNHLSLLPDEVRTPANLEGEVMSPEEEAEHMEQYAKQRADYEEKQLQKMEELRAKRSGGGGKEVIMEIPGGGGYDMVAPLLGPSAAEGPSSTTPVKTAAQGVRVRADPYEDPADAVSVSAAQKLGVAKKPGTSPTTQVKKMTVGASEAGEEYTPVFNPLPDGQVAGKIPLQGGHGKSGGRTLSDSSPTTKSSHSARGLGNSYENSPVSSPSKKGQDAPGVGDSSPEEMKRHDLTRHPSRKGAKEVVEFDPNKSRKFRVTTKKPSSGGKVEEVDGSAETSEDGGGRHKSFSLQATEDTGQLSYALVNLVDKKKNRTASDTFKVEGSGIPQHVQVPISTTS